MHALIPTGEATAILPTGTTSPVTVIGTEAIRATFDETCLRQAVNSRLAPGVTDLVLNPDGHCGYGAPVGCVLVSPTHIYPGPVGVDIKCSMSLLQLDLPQGAIAEKPLRRRLIEAVCARHKVRLVDADFRFPLRHPAVVSVIPGGQGVAEMASNLAAEQAEVPAALWADLKAEGLLRADAPV